MSESTLALNRTEFRQSVGLLAGFGLDYTTWDAGQNAQVDHVVNVGFRRTYSPPVLPGEPHSHTWSFMEPVITSITINAQYTTGTVSVTTGTGVVTLNLGVTPSDGGFPTWANLGNILINGTSYSVASRTDATHLVLDNTTVSIAAGTTYALSQSDYQLPDSFGGFMGDLYYTSTSGTANRSTVRRVDMSQILAWRAWPNQTGVQPYAYAIQPAASTGIAQQYWTLSLWPNPIATAYLVGKYVLNPDAMTASAVYPLGGYPFAEVLREGCLAAFETEITGEQGIHYGLWMQQLQAAISFDRRTSNPGCLGQLPAGWPDRQPAGGYVGGYRDWLHWRGQGAITYT